MSECKCSMSISLLGEGCRYCQPQEYINRVEEDLEDLERQLSKREDDYRKLRKRSDRQIEKLHKQLKEKGE